MTGPIAEAGPTAAPRSRPLRRTAADWWLNSLAAGIGGFALAIALSGLFAWLGPGGLEPMNKYQLNMWIVPPLWLVIASFALNGARGWRTCAVMALANLVAWGLLAAVQAAGR